MALIDEEHVPLEINDTTGEVGFLLFMTSTPYTFLFYQSKYLACSYNCALWLLDQIYRQS
jgi:hypothetical protein